MFTNQLELMALDLSFSSPFKTRSKTSNSCPHLSSSYYGDVEGIDNFHCLQSSVFTVRNFKEKIKCYLEFQNKTPTRWYFEGGYYADM